MRLAACGKEIYTSLFKLFKEGIVVSVIRQFSEEILIQLSLKYREEIVAAVRRQLNQIYFSSPKKESELLGKIVWRNI